jgi:hypothetical protein
MTEQNFFWDNERAAQPLPSDLINLLKEEEQAERAPRCACANGEDNCIGC